MTTPPHPSELFPELPRTKAEALATGSRLFYLAMPCRKGHYAPRNTHSLNCTACVAERRQTGRERYAKLQKKARDLVKKQAERLIEAEVRRRVEALELDTKEAVKAAVKAAVKKERRKADARVTRATNKAKAATTKEPEEAAPATLGIPGVPPAKEAPPAWAEFADCLSDAASTPWD